MKQAFELLGRVLMLPLGVFNSVTARVAGAERAALATKFLIFVTGGGLGWLLNIAVTVLLSRLFGVWHMLAYAIGLVFNISFNFSFHKYVTFGVRTELRHSAIFAVITLLIVAANWLLVYFFTEILFRDQPVLVFAAVSLVVTLFLSVVNFAANKLFVFRG